jgi:capsular exopolysaccharide synthesis family protein
MVGDDIPFAASEAYKLLRTKIQYSFSDDKNCHIIGVSSALAGEGKSTTSVNLACVLAQLNKKVLLVDCDLRRPSIAAKMKMSNEKGLSGYLTRQCDVEEIVREYQMKHGVSFAVVPAGKIPPNPTELLNSSRMAKFMDRFAKNFDYVILDLPPVEEVSDALVAAKLADGVLLAVRQDYCNRIALDDTIQQFSFVGGRILGLLMTCASESSKGYGKSYYKRYYSRYGRYRKYARYYEESHKEQASKEKA